MASRYEQKCSTVNYNREQCSQTDTTNYLRHNQSVSCHNFGLPDTYDGNYDIEEYLSYFVDFSELSSWDSRTMLLVLAVSLRGKARIFYMSLDSTDQRDYDSLVGKLRERFANRKHHLFWLNQLENRRRQQDESIIALGYDLKQLAQKAYPDLNNKAHERIAVNKFYELIPLEMKIRCIENNCETISTAVQLVDIYNCITGSSFPVVRSVKTSVQDAAESQVLDLVQRIEARIKLIEDHFKSDQRKARKQMSKRCFLCNSKKHLQRKCPQKFEKGNKTTTGSFPCRRDNVSTKTCEKDMNIKHEQCHAAPINQRNVHRVNNDAQRYTSKHITNRNIPGKVHAAVTNPARNDVPISINEGHRMSKQHGKRNLRSVPSFQHTSKMYRQHPDNTFNKRNICHQPSGYWKLRRPLNRQKINVRHRTRPERHDHQQRNRGVPEEQLLRQKSVTYVKWH